MKLKLLRVGSFTMLSVMVCTLMFGSTPLTARAEQAGPAEEWQSLKSRLSTYGGTWDTPEYKEAVNDNMPQTALMGNGDVGVVSYGNDKEKTYLISKSDFISCGDLVTSAPFQADDRSSRQIALGGVTIKED